ncbi:PepSY domain-containing protein [Desulfitobacterium metallireducens]|uniref:S-layer protein n=1 Tax=Desulfitobacterium metallireducens DSM 15288 TaxID=871968 RepID=W0EAJ6_9FIRM|nr:PepSY domain-containing protein [Desulfitobacterium metallireducens]AHF06086.1 S-layer protein [Desulfitobacterium metallireducens DSM 15288]
MGHKRFLNIIVACLVILQFSVYPKSALGADQTISPAASVSEKVLISADQALQIAKSNFQIPQKYTQLFTNFNDYNGRTSYSLNWNSTEPPGGSFNVEVDASTGKILSMNNWDQPGQPSFKIPTITSSEAEKIALELVTKLAGDYLPDLKLVKNEGQVVTLNNYQPFMYNFRWMRVVNGIPFPGNEINVSVSGEDGQVQNYYFNWSKDLAFPDASKVISLEKANQVFTDTSMLELMYYLSPAMDINNPKPLRVLPVYSLSSQYLNGAIDALSGNPVTLDPQVGIYKAMGAAMGDTPTGVSQDTKVNDPQVSRDKAVEIVKKMIDIPNDLTLRNSSLNPDWQNPNTQVWQLDWRPEPFGPGDNRYLNARVNANTGDLISLNLPSTINPSDSSEPITREEAQQVAEEFLKRAQPQHFTETKLQTPYPYGGKMPPNLQSFNYVRQVNGIPVSNNMMNVAVDTVSKRVIQYNMNWSNVEFPGLDNLISLNQATEIFLKERPLTLSYTLIYQQIEQKDVRLVYQPQINYSPSTAQMIDAKTGDPLDWSGKPKSQWVVPLYFNDIQGNFAEKEIGLMGLTGAFGEYGDQFNPNKTATVLELLRAMAIAEGNGRDRVLSDDEVLKLAKERGWMKGDTYVLHELNREYLSKVVIRLIGMEKAAQVKGIYTVPFADVGSISGDSMGYIALTWGLGLLKIDDTHFAPQKGVTRAEAAYALVHAYDVLNRK